MFTDQFEDIDCQIHGIRLPKFRLSQEDARELGVPIDIPNRELFKLLIEKGFKEKLDNGEIPRESFQHYRERLDYEIGVVEPTDWVDYFLEVWEDIKIAKKNGIAIGPGRGCLSGDSLVQLQDGLKPLKEINIGDKVVNKNGEIDTVINKFEYLCNEKMARITTWCGTNKEKPLLTLDHKVLVLKNPFHVSKCGVKNFRSLDHKKYFDSKKLKWVSVKDIEKHDYLVRHIGQTKSEKDIDFIDLAQFAEYYDEEFVYETRHINTQHPLSMISIFRETGIGTKCLSKIKNGKSCEKNKNFQKLLEYLKSIGFSLDDFQKHSTKNTFKLKRFLPIDEKFCYTLGFYIGDGWSDEALIQIVLNSITDRDKQTRLVEYFSNFGIVTVPNKKKKENCIDLRVYSKIFAKLLSSLCGKGAFNKVVPDSFLKLPDYKLKFLLDGLLDSDGHRRKNGCLSFCTVSFKLAFQVRWLLERTGNTCSMSIPNDEKRSAIYVLNAKRAKDRSSYNDGKYVYCLVRDKEIVENLDKKVYDISVKNDPSYHTLDYIVHNSAAGSLMLYTLGITEIDSVKYGLYFERFLSESRLTPAIVNGERFYSEAVDIDTDCSDDKRHILIDALKEKHKGHFCKVSTIGTLQGKKNIKEVCKIVLGYSEQKSLEVSSMIPTLFGKVHPLKKAVEESSEFKKFTEKNEKAYKIALKLSELPCSRGAHASAYIISDEPLVESVPCEMGEDEMVTSYDMNQVMLYNIKLDLLGLKAVSVIDEVCQSLDIDIAKVDLNYDNVYKYLQDVKTPYGLFQVSGSSNLKVVNEIKPKNIDHLAAVVAIARPGAMEFTSKYAKFVNEGECESVHSFFDEVLKPTAGLALYQESSVKMCEKIGLSKVEGESVRRGISKKKIKEIKKWEEVIFRKAQEQKLDPEIPKVLWRILEASASYSFNRCLSGSTVIYTDKGVDGVPIQDIKIGDKIFAYHTKGHYSHYVEVINIYTSETELFEFVFDTGEKIECSLRHKFLTELGMMTIEEIRDHKYGIRRMLSGYAKIVSWKSLGIQKSYDLEVDHSDHNFYANNLVTSNSHSYSYGTLAAQTVFLKFKYPQHFFLACLRQAATRGDFLEHFEQIQHELPHFGIKLLPPNITKSDVDFKIEGNDIRFGIGEIKGISDKSIDKLREFTSNRGSSDFQVFNAAKDAKLSIGVLSSLIQSGALGHDINSRSRKVLEAQVWNILTPKEKLYCLKRESEGDLISLLKKYLEWTDDNGKIFTKESRLETIRKKSAGYFKIYNLNHKNELLASYFYEKMLLGFSYSTSLKMIFGDKNEEIRNIKEIDEFVPVKGYYELVATVKEVIRGKSKNGNEYLKLKLADETGETSAMLLGEKLFRYSENYEDPKEDDIIYLVGNKGDSILWVNKMEIQNVKVYTKLSELKDLKKEEETSVTSQ